MVLQSFLNYHRKLNARIGIDLNRYLPDTYTRQNHINNRGDAHARHILCFAIRKMVRQQAAAPNHIVDDYYRLKKDLIPNGIRSQWCRLGCPGFFPELPKGRA